MCRERQEKTRLIPVQKVKNNIIKFKRRKKSWTYVTVKNLCAEQRDKGEKGSRLHLWRKKTPPNLWEKCVYSYECKCLKSNQTLLVNPSHSHTVTVCMNLVKGQAVSQLLLPYNRRENKPRWEMTEQIRHKLHILSVPPACPHLHQRL